MPPTTTILSGQAGDLTLSRNVTTAPAAAGRRWASAVLAALFALALLPRLVGLGEAVTEDEDQWIQRSGGFARALDQGAWRGTFQIGHPGVTAMWLTTLALGTERARRFAIPERDERLVSQVEDFLPALHAARPLFAVVNAALVTLCGALAWRLFGPGPGLLAGLLAALEPYWVAMSPIVGMDGLLGGLIGAALLGAIVGLGGGRPLVGGRPSGPLPSPAWALASGLLTGLALLTKGPAVFLVLLLPLLAFEQVWAAPERPAAARATIGRLAVWGGGALFGLLAWPALWADPLGTAVRTIEFVREIGTTPHQPGNFFLGQPVVDPGPLFYPVALALRLGPATALGLLALGPGLLRRRAGAGRVGGPAAGFLAVFVLLFALGLTASPKKVDRYLLPLFPALAALAALGWWSVLRALPAWIGGGPGLVAGGALVGLLQLWPLAQSAPHPLAAFNPLVGGIGAAERAIPIGWGEGLDRVGDYLAAQPNADELVTAIWYPLWVNFQAEAPGRVVNIAFSGPGQVSTRALYEQADFYVDYIHARQRGLTPRALVGRQPDLVVRLQGVDYARVYRLRP